MLQKLANFYFDWKTYLTYFRGKKVKKEPYNQNFFLITIKQH